MSTSYNTARAKLSRDPVLAPVIGAAHKVFLRYINDKVQEIMFNCGYVTRTVLCGDLASEFQKIQKCFRTAGKNATLDGYAADEFISKTLDWIRSQIKGDLTAEARLDYDQRPVSYIDENGESVLTAFHNVDPATVKSVLRRTLSALRQRIVRTTDYLTP